MLDGTRDVSEWDDEELYEGKIRNVKGHFSGPKPRLVPHSVHAELVKRNLGWVKHEFAHSLPKAMAVLNRIMDSPSAENADKLKAAEIVINRVMGKASEKLDINLGMVEAPWQKALRIAIVGTQQQLPEVIEGKVIPDDDEVIDPS